jgi:hypothetical protein
MVQSWQRLSLPERGAAVTPSVVLMLPQKSFIRVAAAKIAGAKVGRALSMMRLIP